MTKVALKANVRALELRLRQNPWLAGCSGAERYLVTRAETWLVRHIPELSSIAAINGLTNE